MLDINMEWRMVGKPAPQAEKLTRLKNIRLINVRGNVQNVGTMHGFAEAPFGSDVFHFENCEIKAQTGLKRTNADGVSLDGLSIILP